MFTSPLNPGLEVLYTDLVSLDGLSAVVEIDRVEGELLFAGNELGHKLKVSSELINVACLAGIITGGLDTACEPCYDFTPVTGSTFGSSLLAVRSLTSGISDSHGVTGGVYKTRERIHRSILICDY